MLSVSHMYKSYGPLSVLRDLSFSVERGKVVTITGPSGSGKTTLLQILGTLDRPDQGRVVIDGTDVSTLPPTELARFRNHTIGFVFQGNQLLPEFTAWENIILPACIAFGESPVAPPAVPDEPLRPSSIEQYGAAVRWCMSLVRECGIEDCLSKYPRQLSGGQQQRAAIARALCLNPPLVLADEPTGNLDPANVDTVMRVLTSLQQKCHNTIILSTHNYALTEYADFNLQLTV
ncbi:MAG: ABC transporter ATP-binding protein [Paludibacteraceae bacterium]|nr:ABC transporter ATP-binding protein [Paludibacteraceae bacterium]